MWVYIFSHSRRRKLIVSNALVRYVPEWVPGSRVKRVLRVEGQKLFETEDMPFTWAKKQIVSTDVLRILA